MERPRLSREVRRSLRERLRFLEEERIPHLMRELAASGDSAAAVALRISREETARVRHTLCVGLPLEEAAHDPGTVELGDTVTVRRTRSSSRERFTLVGELEARLDESWISVEAPLGSALLGTRVGEVVEISLRDRRVRYRVLAIERRAQ
jgi:transcription elongation GreA/GreB family factor